jgi:hypothetical protein
MSSLICSLSGIFKFYLVYKLCHFLALPYLNFNQLFLHDLGLNFEYFTPYNISNVHKIYINFGLLESRKIIFNIL